MNKIVVNVRGCVFSTTSEMLDNLIEYEIIPSEIFDGCEEYADDNNTKFINGEWVFEFDKSAHTLKEQKKEFESAIAGEVEWANSELDAVSRELTIHVVADDASIYAACSIEDLKSYGASVLAYRDEVGKMNFVARSFVFPPRPVMPGW